MISYKEYLHHIKEGLIYTHNILKHKTSLNIQLDSIGVDYKFEELNKLSFNIIIFNIDYFFQNNLYDSFFNTIINLYGYFPVYFIVERKNGMVNRFLFDEYVFKKNLTDLTDNITIRFEAKYDDGERKNDLKVPDKLYHISPSIYHEKIMNNGLEPRSHNRITKHTPRIYLFYFLEDANDLIKRFKNNDILKFGKEKEYNVYKIDLSSMKDIIIHSDPNFEKGCYTYDNIHPNYIKTINMNENIGKT